MSFKSPRLLVDAIHKEMDELRKLLMSHEPGDYKVTSADLSSAQITVNDLSKLFDELAAMADRPSIDDVLKLSPGDYVATMKPLVAKYHRQLMTVDILAPALCEDLQATGCILILIGDGKTVVRTAHDPNRPEVALAVEALLAAIDTGTAQVLTDGAAEAEKQLGLGEQLVSDMPENSPLRVRYGDPIQPDDAERNRKAELVIDFDGVVVKDRIGGIDGPAGRKATQEEIDSCVIVKDPGTGVGYDD